MKPDHDKSCYCLSEFILFFQQVQVSENHLGKSYSQFLYLRIHLIMRNLRVPQVGIKFLFHQVLTWVEFSLGYLLLSSSSHCLQLINCVIPGMWIAANKQVLLLAKQNPADRSANWLASHMEGIQKEIILKKNANEWQIAQHLHR